MKNKIQILLAMIGLIALVSGCAQFGPAMIDPAVYKSSRDTIVAENQAAKNNISLEQARANEWNKVAVEEIQGKTIGGGKNLTITSERVLGGFPCIFINDSQRSKTLTIQKVGGLLNGHKWDFKITGNGGIKKYKLLVGDYTCQWITEYSDQKYPTTGPDHFLVTIEPHFYYGETQENYHGGYRLFGY